MQKVYVYNTKSELVDEYETEAVETPEETPNDYVTWDELASAYNEGVESVG